MKYGKLATQPVPQSAPLDPRQVPNHADGYVYPIDDWARLRRFLIIGGDANTYYQKAVDLTRENAACVTRCYDLDAERTVREIVEVSVEGRAPKNDPAIFALAIGAAHADTKVRQRSLAALNSVCRTSTHLFGFVTAVDALGRGWGRSLKRAVANWYNSKQVSDLSFQFIKYRAREGWSHGDLMKIAHPTAMVGSQGVADSIQRIAMYRWARGLPHETAELPPLIQAHIQAMLRKTVDTELLRLIHEYRLPWEAIPTEVNSDPQVQGALLPHMGLTALIRQLGRLTTGGVLAPLSADTDRVVEQLLHRAVLKKARIHPMQILLAHAAYSMGRPAMGGERRGSTVTWKPVRQIVDALDEAFTLAFDAVEPTGRRIMTGIDISGSMMNPFGGTMLTVRRAAAAMALVTARTEKRAFAVGYAGRVAPINIGAKSSLDSIDAAIDRMAVGTSTDCALPMLYAAQEGIEVDMFVNITDNETHCGPVHPMAALRQYRKKTGIAAKLVVIGMTSTGFSIADPEDAGAMNVVGFDTAVPTVIADFARA